MTRVLRAFCVSLALAGVVPSLAAQSAPVAADGPVLSPGDMVHLIVWRNEEMSGEFEVTPEGVLGHPILREVQVAGVPVSVAEDRLRAFLGRFESQPNLVLLPRYRVTIGGEVSNPGVHAFSPNISVGQALVLSGGPGPRGRMDRVRLVRDGEEQVLDLRDLDAPPARQLIRSGDYLLVERRWTPFRDYVVPAVTLLGAVTAILNYMSRL